MLKSAFSLEGVRRGNGPAGARRDNTLRHPCQLSLNKARLDSPKMQPVKNVHQLKGVALSEVPPLAIRYWAGQQTGTSCVILIFKAKNCFSFLPNKVRDKKIQSKIPNATSFLEITCFDNTYFEFIRTRKLTTFSWYIFHLNLHRKRILSR